MNVSIKFIGGIKLKSLSEKIYMELEMPGEYNTIGDKDRIINALLEKYENITMPYKIIKKLSQITPNL